MATIRRGNVVNKFIDRLKLDVNTGVPVQTSDKILQTFDFSNSNYCDIVASQTVTNSTSGTVMTTASDKDFMLCTANLNVQRDANSTSLRSELKVVIGGASVSVLKLAGLTTTAQDAATSVTFNPPLKIDRNTSIQILNNTNVANITAGAAISGYYIEG